MIKQHFPNKRSKMCLTLLMLMTLTILFSCSVLICMLFGAWHCWKKEHAWSANHPQIHFFLKEWERERPLPWIKAKSKPPVPLLHSLMLKSNTSSPSKPWAWVLFPWAVDLDPACYRPKHTRSALVSWLLLWRPGQIRHDECRLFAVWQTHSFTVGWCLQEGQSCSTLSLRGTGRERGRKRKGRKCGQSADETERRWETELKTSVWK